MKKRTYAMNTAVILALLIWSYFLYRELIYCPEYALERPNSKAPGASCSVAGWMQIFYLLIIPLVLGVIGFRISKLSKSITWLIIVFIPFLLLSFLRIEFGV